MKKYLSMEVFMVSAALVFYAVVSVWPPVLGQGYGVTGAENLGTKDKVVLVRPNLDVTPDPAGTLTTMIDPAAYTWHDGKELPTRPDGLIDPATGKRVLKWPILALPMSGNPTIVWFGKDKETDAVGKFRNSNWYMWTPPARWAYVRIGKEKWNPTTHQFYIPGVEDVPTVSTPNKPGVHMDDVQGQAMVDDLRRSFTWEQVQNFGDRSPYDEPDTGAPFEPGAP